VVALRFVLHRTQFNSILRCSECIRCGLLRSVSLSITRVTQLRCTNTAERIEVLLSEEALGDPRNIALDCSLDLPYKFDAAFCEPRATPDWVIHLKGGRSDVGSIMSRFIGLVCGIRQGGVLSRFILTVLLKKLLRVISAAI